MEVKCCRSASGEKFLLSHERKTFPCAVESVGDLRGQSYEQARLTHAKAVHANKGLITERRVEMKGSRWWWGGAYQRIFGIATVMREMTIEENKHTRTRYYMALASCLAHMSETLASTAADVGAYA